MLKTKSVLAAIAAISIFGACPASAKKAPELTPMELQAIQSKEFQTTRELLFASAMSVFQDLGYTINSADVQTGFISASSPVVNKTNFWGAMGGVPSQGLTKSTAFIEALPNGYARIRINFLTSVETTYGYGQRIQRETPILDPAPYRTAWEKIDEALFVRNALEKTSPAPK